MATEEVGIRLTLAGRREAAAGLKDAEQGLDRVGEAAQDAGNKAEVSGRKFDRTRGVIGSIAGGVMVGVKAFGVLAAAAGAIGIKTAASMETAKIGFTTMLGSGKKASVFLADLSKFAAKTPFEFPDLQTAASRLVSAGIETRKIIPIMTTLGDVTAGMGTGAEGVTRATNALQQMSAAGRISAEDLNQLRDAGIPVFDLLAKAMGKTKAEVITLKDEGKLGGDALNKMMKALETGKGLEKFNGLMKKQSGSLTGTWSTLKDTVNMGLAKAVKPALPLIKDLVLAASDLAEKAMPKIRSGVKAAAGAITAFVAAVETGGIKDALSGLSAPGTEKGASGIAAALGKIGTSLSDVDWAAVKDGLGEGVADTVSVFGVAIAFAADHIDELAKYLPGLIAAYAAFKIAQAAGNVVALAAIPLTAAQVVSNFALAGAMRAQTAATTTAAVAQRGLNLAMLMNPIGLVVLAIVALVAGFVILYKKSETFRALISILWNGLLKPFGQWLGGVLLNGILKLASALLSMARFGVMSFRLLVTAAIRAFDGILGAAEAGLGWIPGIGDKIKGARAAFNEFGDSAINKLKAVENKLRDAQGAVDELARDRSATITVNTVYGPRDPGLGIGPRMPKSEPRAAGDPAIDGEKRPRMFVPQVDGVTPPRAPEATSAATPRFKPGGMPQMVTRVFLDGKEISKNTLDHVNARVARA